MPAGLKLTAPWCAMTFALPLHVFSHYLCRERQTIRQTRNAVMTLLMLCVLHSSFTCRPTRLLCILMRAWMSLGDPRESSQSLEKRSPKRTSWLQPPHSQVSCMELSSSGKGLSRVEGCVDCRLEGRSPWWLFNSEGNDRVMPRPTPPFCRACSCSCVSFNRILSSSWRRLASQPQPRSLPILQAEATEWATPAASKAREKALSRNPGWGRYTMRVPN